ncbi:hypothetical protein J7K74_02885 [Candidatus Woesearchaeota archaeon]|nr:hypothetical protein [Candidatus Woesearchaeota archaeon]
MELAKHVAIRVFVKPEDEESLILEALKKLVGINSEDFEKCLKREEAMGFNERRIIILRVILEKRRLINAFLKNLFSSLTPEDKKVILNQLESRIDEYCHFYIRLEKDLLLQDVYSLTDTGNCFHIDITLPVYPCKKEKAKIIARRIIESFME